MKKDYRKSEKNYRKSGESCRKSGKKIWKKYRVAILIELGMICVMVFLGYLIYQLELSGICDESADAMENMHMTWNDECPYEGQNDTLDSLMNHMLSSRPGLSVSYAFQDLQDCYGMYLEFYDSEGNVLAKTTPHTLALGWESEKSGYDAEQIDVIFLEQYFSEEEIQPFFAWAGEANRFQVKNITGYYDEENDFIPVKVLYKESGTGDEEHKIDGGREFLLERSIADDAIPADKMVCLCNWYFYQNEESPGEIGSFILYDFNVSTRANELAEAFAKKCGMSGPGIVTGEEGGGGKDSEKYIYAGQLAGGEAAGYTLALYIDNQRLALLSRDFTSSVKKMLLFCQGLAIILMGMCLYFQKKEREVKNMRDIFINAIAHEMKTPVAVIQNSVECLQAEIRPEKQVHYQEMIGQEAGHMNELLNSMLTYTRVSDSDYELKKEKCSLEKLVKQVCSRYFSLMQDKNIALRVESSRSGMDGAENGNTAAGESGPVSCDARLIETVIDNFISNAVKFCPAGGMIRICTEKKGIRVFNEGEQIPENCVKHIWEPLYKVDKSRTVESGDSSVSGISDDFNNSGGPGSSSGSGMGLAISEAILKLHGADYGAVNVPGGMEFYFYLK